MHPSSSASPSPDLGYWREQLDAALAAEVRALATSSGSTRSAVLLAAFEALVGRLGAREDFVAAATVAGRRWPLRARTPATATFRDLVAAAREAADGEEPPPAEADLALTLDAGGDVLEVTWTYRGELFDATTVRRFAASFELLLSAALADPDTALGELPLHGPALWHQVWREWNDQPALGPGRLLHDLVAEQAARTPERTALVLGEEEVSFGELDRRADRLARYLVDRGARPDTLIGVCLERSPELVTTLLAVLKSGAGYLPLDPTLPPERLAFMIDDAGARLVVTQESHRSRLPVPGPRLLLCEQLATELAAAGAEPPAAPAVPGNVAYVIYTSGSTGEPKGVVVPHAAIASRMQWVRRDDFDETTCFLLKASIGFDLSVAETFATLVSGGRLVIVPPGLEKQTGPLVELIREQGVTDPSFQVALLKILVSDRRFGELPRVRRVITGAEAVPPELIERFYELFPTARLENRYGPTETTISVTSWPFPRHTRDAVVPIGRPTAGAEVLLGDRRGRPVPAGVHGEILIGGPSLARGYLKRPRPTAESFVPHPFGDAGARLYRSGDLGRLRADGALEFHGRIDSQVKVRGFRIELGEIESVLGRHRRVGRAVVVEVEPGAGGNALAAFVTPEDAPLDELRQALSETLPEYMVPSFWTALATLPLNPAGKVDRRALRALWTAAAADGGEDEEPATPLERTLARMWRELLGLERLGRHTNLFELGGHSLAIAQFVARLREETSFELDPVRVFAGPSVAEIAAALEAPDGTGAFPPMTPIERSERAGPIPLTFPQEQVWFVNQLSPGNLAYNSQLAVRLAGPLDPGVLEQALAEVVRRHESLRTTFPAEDGVPVQKVHPPWPVRVPVEDLRTVPAAEREAAAEARISELVGRRFDVETLPLVAWTLLRLADEDHFFVQVEHHFVHDGWSISVFVRELTTLYEAFAAGRPSPLAELPIQLADFALWQRRRITPEVVAAQIERWHAQRRPSTAVGEAGAPRPVPPPLELPTDRPRPRRLSLRGDLLRFQLPDASSAALRAFVRRRRVTLFMAMLAAFEAWLFRCTGRRELLLGSGVAARRSREAEKLIGMIVNTVALYADVGGGPSFDELLERVRRIVASSQENQELPFEKLVEHLHPDREAARNPLFQVLFSFHDSPVPDLDFAGLRGRLTGRHNGSAKSDLNLVVIPLAEQRVGRDVRDADDERLTMAWEFSTDLFDRTTVERMWHGYRRLLDAAVAEPGRRVAELSFLSPAERQQIVREAGEAVAPRPGAATVEGLFAAAAARHGGRTALVWDGGEMSYHELDRRSSALAHELRRRGVGAETPVGLLFERSPEMVIAVLAVAKAGGFYVPLDPGHPEGRRRRLLADAGAVTVLAEDDVRRAGAAPAAELAPNRPDQLLYVMYTSGSTGEPKGVAVPHRAVVRLVRGTGFARFAPDETLLHLAPASFDASTLELWGALAHGATLAVAPPGPLSLEALGDFVERHRVSLLWLTAGLFHQVVDARLEQFRGVRQLLAGGDVLSPGHVRRVLERLPATTMVNGYGPTENTTFTCCHRVRSLAGGASVPIGRPIDGTRVHVLDGALGPVPLGAAGELWTGGLGLARGYLARPGSTAERFLPDPFGGAGERLYCTGDLARFRADGVLEFLGRADHQVKLRGFRVELGEVESALNGLGAVGQAAVVLHEDERGERSLAAYVASDLDLTDEDALALLSAELRERLAEQLPAYMVPSSFTFLEQLPLNENGKVDRRRLPAPEHRRPREAAPSEPRSAVEGVLTEIWQDVLDVEGVGSHDDFFELGGHSLLATRLASRVRASLSYELELRELFEATTPAALAARIEAAGPAAAAPGVERVDRADLAEGFPLSFAQERLWLHDRLEPGSPVYNMPRAFRVRGPLDAAALAAALAGLVRRHEVLRSRFPVRGDAPVVETADADAAPRLAALPEIDLGALAPEARRRELERLARAEAARPFDLERGPLLRCRLLRLAEDGHAFFFALHHAVSDEWSMGILRRDLAELYRAASAGDAARLPALPVQYADYAVWQRRWLDGGAREAQLAYWREHLAGAPARIELPLDRPRPATPSSQGALHRVRLGTAWADGVRALSRRSGATPFMVLLSVFEALLGRLTAQDDFVVATPAANRRRGEVEELIGFFVNMVALRVRLRDAATFGDLVAAAREAVLGAEAHQDVPFEQVVEALVPERGPGFVPFLQAVLAFETGSRAFELPGLELEALPLAPRTSHFELGLTLRRGGDRPEGWWSFRDELFDATTVRRFAAGFEVLGAAALADPGAALADLPALAPALRHQLLFEDNDVPVALYDALSHDGAASVDRLFVTVAAAHRNRPALVWDGGEMSYGELDRRSGALARELLRRGVGPESGVGLLFERSPEMVVAMLAVLRAGGFYVPLDPTVPEARRQGMAETAGLATVLDAGDLKGAAPSSAGSLPANRPEQLAYVMFTSGSTGEPKGIGIPHQGIVRLVRGTSYARFGPGETFLQLAAVSFDLVTLEVWGALLNGGRVAIPPPGLLSLEELGSFIERHGVTFLWLTSGLFHEMVDGPLAKLRGVRQLLAGGDVLSPPHVLRVLERLPETAMINGYGPTENTTFTTCHRVRSLRSGASVPIGRTIAGTRVYVVGAGPRLAGVGVGGELWTGGLGLARGYAARPGLTAERFVPDPFGAPGGRLYRTGDLARRLPGGELEFLGRTDHQLKLRGFRIELGEIEIALSRHPALEQVTVVAVEAGGSRRLAAYVVPRSEAGDLSTGDLSAELTAFAGEHLPDPMVPSAFVVLEALPLNRHGKVDRRSLPAPSWADRSAVRQAPRTALEKSLVEIWEAALGRRGLGVHDNFFALGGDSITSIRIARLAARHGLDLSPRQILRKPTVAGLAGVLAGGSDEVPAVDLEAEVAAIPELGPFAAPRPAATEAVLLTGANGFLGIHLLDELLRETTARVYCLVRAADEAAARRRLDQALAAWRLPAAPEGRVVALPGDLAKPFLGLGETAFFDLAAEVDTLLHNGSRVSVQPYSELRPVNVLGTQEVLRLAAAGRARSLHYVSTIGVANAQAGRTKLEVPSRDLEGLKSSYDQSKWVAESLVLRAGDAGLPVTVSRPVRIAGSRETGLSNTGDWVCRWIRGCRALGTVAPLAQRSGHLVPVDHVARAAVYLSLHPPEEPSRRIFHLSAEPLAFSEWITVDRALGRRIEEVDADRWIEQLDRAGEQNPLFPLLPAIRKRRLFTSEADTVPLVVDDKNSVAVLGAAGICRPVVDRGLLELYLSRLDESP